MEREVRSHDYFPNEDNYIVPLPALKQRGLPGLGRLVTRYVPTPSRVPNSQFRAAFSNWHQFCIQVPHHPQALRVVSSWPCAPSIYCIVFWSVRHQQPPLTPCMQRHLQTRASQAAVLTRDWHEHDLLAPLECVSLKLCSLLPVRGCVLRGMHGCCVCVLQHVQCKCTRMW